MATTESKTRKKCLRWFGHMQRRPINALTMSDKILIKGPARSRHIKRTWIESWPIDALIMSYMILM